MKLQWYPGTVRDRNGSQELQRDRYVSQGLQRYHSAAMGPEDGIETAMAATAMGRTAVGPCNCYGTIMGPRAHIGTAIAAIGFQRPLMFPCTGMGPGDMEASRNTMGHGGEQLVLLV